MPTISKISLFNQSEQHVLSIRTVINFNDFPEIAGRAYEKLMEYAATKNLLFAGCPFVCYHNTNLENLEVEMGFPVANPTPGNGDDITGYTIPVQKAFSGMFLGAYEDTDPLMFEIMETAAQQGYEQQGPIYHYYLNNSDRQASELLTRIVVPVK